jgi:hypothetical protein
MSHSRRARIQFPFPDLISYSYQASLPPKNLAFIFTVPFFSTIRRRHHEQNTHFIFYTATYTDPRDEAFALSLGADLFLVKPMESAPFLNRVEKTISQWCRDSIFHPGTVDTKE